MSLLTPSLLCIAGHQDRITLCQRVRQGACQVVSCRSGQLTCGVDSRYLSGTASYRLMPDIELTQEVTGEKARRLQACFAKGVIALEPTADGDVRAKVANPRLCTMSREVFRHPDLVDLVRVQRIRDHFICKLVTIYLNSPRHYSFCRIYWQSACRCFS